MPGLPVYISAIFVATTLLTVWLFYLAAGKSRLALLIPFGWLAFQGAVGSTGFYNVTDTLPPRFILLVTPALLFLIALFAVPAGRLFLDQLNLAQLTLVHVVRIPVEIVLYLLFVNNAVPELMTFEGRNFDILAGLTAPFVWYFGFRKAKLTKGFMTAWNIACFILLLNIVFHGILSVQSPFQQFGFEQPNRALMYFPFVWLPCFVVPVVLLSHLTVLRALFNSNFI